MSIGRVPGATGIQPSIVDAKGDLIVATAADSVSRLAVGTNEQRLVADSAAATGLKYVADTTNYAIAAKGDLLVGTGADTLAALTVGTNGHTLVADSGETTGLKWAAPSSMTLITSGNLGTNGVSLTSITGAYTDLYLYIYGVKFDTSGKYIGVWEGGSSASLKVTQLMNTTADTSTYIRFGSTQQYLSGVMALGILWKNYTNTSGRKPIFYAGSSNDGTNDNELVGGGIANTTSAITRLDVENAVGGGNITAGSYELWGIK